MFFQNSIFYNYCEKKILNYKTNLTSSKNTLKKYYMTFIVYLSTTFNVFMCNVCTY